MKSPPAILLSESSQTVLGTESSGKADSPNSHSEDMDPSADHGGERLWATAVYKVELC